MILSYKYKFLILSTFSALILSCSPKDDSINPADYELYISISADKNPAISPDGNLIAYYHLSLEFPMPEDYPTGLYVMNSNGTNRRLLLSGDHWSPNWSPDGQWIVFTSAGIIEIINLEGDSIRTSLNLFDNLMYFPNWSPNGESIIFSAAFGEGGIYISDPLFITGRKLIKNLGLPGADPCWSPDQSKILYIKYVSDSEELFIIDSTGMNDTPITNNGKINRYPAWSPNGNLVTWSKDVQIMVMDINGTNLKKLDYGNYPAWSPGSDYIVYSNANKEFTKEVIWRISVDGSNKIQLTY